MEHKRREKILQTFPHEKQCSQVKAKVPNADRKSFENYGISAAGWHLSCATSQDLKLDKDERLVGLVISLGKEAKLMS